MSTFVLVHGAWCDGSVWQQVTPPLAAAGHRVEPIAGLPSGGPELGDLAADAKHVRAVVDGLPEGEDVVLVGHSYGGMVITELADHPRVRHSVYLAAFLPGAGESIMDLRSEHTLEWVVPAPAGAALRVTGDPEVARHVMAAGADRVHRLDAGHMVMLSRPREVADLLLGV